MRYAEDTISAVAGGVGGAVSVVRISGSRAFDIAEKVWRGQNPLQRNAERCLVKGQVVDEDGSPVDQCLAAVFPAPRSYTGEDMVEFHTHGGTLAPRQVLQCLLSAGSRMAEPGEFTKRAFVNGKMDLAQAEAVGDLISAHTTMALHLANRQLNGTLSSRINDIFDDLSTLLAEVESRMDFPEEQLDWIPAEKLLDRLDKAAAAIARLQQNRHTGEVLREGVRLVIAGRTNVGKSSLLNSFLGRERAIVTEIPGTTRDTLEELAHVRGIPVRLTDTAGLREAQDLVERTGIDRSKASLREAQIVLWVYDFRTAESAEAPGDTLESTPVIHVANKIDLFADSADSIPADHVAVSALTGQGMEDLYDRIETTVWEQSGMSEPECAISARHGELLDQAVLALQDVRPQLIHEAWELAAIQLRSATEDVGRITGKTASADVLETIFSKFCIGK